jgi:hypothetical protein
MLSQAVTLEVSINAAQHVRLRHVIVKVERVEEFVLRATLTTHHSDTLP